MPSWICRGYIAAMSLLTASLRRLVPGPCFQIGQLMKCCQQTALQMYTGACIRSIGLHGPRKLTFVLSLKNGEERLFSVSFADMQVDVSTIGLFKAIAVFTVACMTGPVRSTPTLLQMMTERQQQPTLIESNMLLLCVQLSVHLVTSSLCPGMHVGDERHNVFDCPGASFDNIRIRHSRLLYDSHGALLFMSPLVWQA